MDYHELENMTVIRLREEAKKFPELKGVSGMKKEELTHALVERLGIVVPEKKAKAAHAPMDRTALKKKMEELRAQKKAANAEHNRKTASLLRRRIHLIKRQIRKTA